MKIHLEELSAWSVVRRLYKGYMRPYSSKIFLAIIFMVIVAISNVLIVKLVQPAVDLVFVNRDESMIFWLPLIVMAIYFIKGISEFYQNFLVEFIGQRILTDLQIDLYKHLVSSDIDLIEKHTSARLISRFTNDIAIMRKSITDFLVGTAKYFLSIVLLIILMFKTEPTMSAIVFFVFPLILYVVSWISKKLRQLSISIQEELGDYTVKLDETFQSIKIIKSFLLEKQEVHKAQKKIDNLLFLYKKSIKYDALVAPLTEIVNGLAVCFIVVYGGILIFNEKTTPGAIFTFITAFLSAYRPFKSVLSLNASLQDGLAASNRLFKLLDTKPIVERAKGTLEINDKYLSIEFKNVVHQIKNKNILKNISFKINPISHVAIVGVSGSGKSSIVNLLLHFKEKTSGQIFIGSNEIDNIELKSLRKNISYVSQDVMLFDGTIMDNIKYGNPKASDEEVFHAARQAQAAEFIEKLPQGYYTEINSKANSLSGGQKQRLAIARALLKKAPILLLDESASGLDVNTEIGIYQTLKQNNSQKTLIVITHRLNTIVDFDNIIVVHDGRIVEQGTHENLLLLKSYYYKLYNSYLKESSNQDL